MVVYQLACDRGHRFEGWFASAQACEHEAESGRLECPTCTSATVRKLPSAPYVHTQGASPAVEEGPDTKREVLRAIKSFVLANTENVGRQFAEIARRIHYREEKARGIRGQVTPEEAEALHEEGIPAIPVPAGIIPSEEVH